MLYGGVVAEVLEKMGQRGRHNAFAQTVLLVAVRRQRAARPSLVCPRKFHRSRALLSVSHRGHRADGISVPDIGQYQPPCQFQPDVRIRQNRVGQAALFRRPSVEKQPSFLCVLPYPRLRLSTLTTSRVWMISSVVEQAPTILNAAFSTLLFGWSRQILEEQALGPFKTQ